MCDSHSDNVVIPPVSTGVGAPDETCSRLCEPEDKVKDLEQKVANVVLTTKLKASHEEETQQLEDIVRLKQQLVQASRAQVSMQNWWSL